VGGNQDKKNMDEQILKDLIATAQANGYNWGETIAKFPELKDFDIQLLKDYVATAENENYNYEVINEKFPEFGFASNLPVKKKDVSEDSSFFGATKERLQDIVKNVTQDGSESVSEDISSESPSGDVSIEDTKKFSLPGMQSLNEKIGFEPTKEAVVEEFGETATIAPTLPIKEQYETYNLAAASKSPTPDFTIYEDYLPAGVKEIPTAEQVIEGEYNAVVPFDQAAYERNKDAYRIIYDNKVKDYEVYLKNNKGYIKADDGRYYSPDKFDSETILNKELSLISEYNIAGKAVPIMDEPNEAIYTYWKDKLEKFGFDLKYSPSAIGTSITVVSSHTGERTGIDLDTWGDDADRRQVEKLKTFVKNNFDEDGVEQKDLIESLSSETRASMGGPTESRYKTVPKGRVISDAEVDIEGIDAALKVAKKNLEEAEALPDVVTEIRSIGGPMSEKFSEVKVANKKKSQKIAQAKQQIKNLEGESVKAQDRLTSAKEGKTQKANAFASEVLSGQVATEAERLEAQGLENRYKYKVSQGVAKKLEDAYQRAKELEEEYHTPEGWTNAEAMAEYNSISKEILPDVKTYSELVKITQESIDTYQVDKENLRQDVGRKVIMDAEMGGVGSSIVRALVSGTGGVVEGFVETIFGDAYANINNLFYNEYEEGYLTDAERKEIKKDSIQDDWVSSVDRSLGITEESAEAYRKNLSYEDMIKNLAYIGPDGQTKDVMEGGNVLTEGLYGLLESMPAMATSIINPGAAVISFASMGINGINKEMESNPMFDNVSENEKLLITLPYGIVMGVLENYGFRNALSNSSLIGKIMMNSLKKSKKAGSRNFRELVLDEIENKVLKVGILTASSAAAEFETGATQQVFEAYIKEGYDVAKGQDYFKQSIDLLNDKYITKEFVGEVWRAGLAEAVGGFAMGAVPAISTAVRENKIAEIPIGRFIVLEKAMLDPTLRKVAKMRLDEDVAMGMKTREDADAEFQDFNITLGQMRAIPQEFDVKSKQQILALESQKKEIGDRIEGKSKFTTREEQRQIKVLEERIEEISAKAKENIPENQARYEEAKTNDGFEGTINEFLNNEILTEELLKVIEKSPEKEAPTESTTEVASEPGVEEVTEEQLAEVRDLEEESKPVAETVVEEEVATEEAPVTKEEQDAKDKARAEKLAELDRNLREATTEKAPVAETQEVVEDGKVPEVTKEQQDRYNNKEMSDEEIKDVLIGLNTKVQMRADGKTEEKITAFERKIKNENETLFREVIGMRPAPKTETKTETPQKKTPKKKVKVETPKKENRTYYVFANPDTGLYEVIDNTSSTNQPVIKTYKTESGADNFVSKLTTAQGRVRFVDETSKKEAPKKDTGVDAKLRAIAVKMDKAAKEKVSSKLTKADRELIKKNTKRFKEINDEVKMPTTTADGIRSAITMIEDSFKDKEAKIKEQIKRIDARVSDRMTKDKDRKKKKDELSKARKEKNARVKELKAKLTDMGAKFRLSDDVAAESPEGFITEDDIVEGMKELGPVEKGFKIPSGIKEGDVDPIAQSKSTKKITDAQAKKLGFKSVSDMLKNIQEFNDIPMIVAMSDVLASGVAKDSMGKKMKVDGGLLYNVLGSNTELAWAGVNETGANTQYNEALDLYRANKELFDRLWKEGKLPQNHVPMVVLRMGNTAINSNEAMFRYLAPLIKSFPKQNQDEAFSVLMESIEGKKNVSQKNKSGRDTVKSAKQLEEIINKNKITDVGSLFDFIVKDAKKRAKGDNENTIPLPARALLFDLVVSPVGVKKPSKGVAKALIKDTQSEGKEFLADKILSDIGETSMMESEAGDAVAIMGVDVINGGVRKANHNNYGFGPKGRLIALIKNPMNGLNIFPEWRAKAVRVFKKDAKGEMPTLEKVLRQVGGAFFIDKAFRGARVQTEQSDIDVISGKMRFAFPGVSVSQTQQEFDEALKQEGIRTAESNGNTILGLTKDGKIFLNPSRKSLSTPIHEFGHIWIDFLRSESSKTKGTKLLKKGLELVEGTKALESAIKKYGDNELAREEALVELMGTKGETIANAAKRAKFIEWFNAFFKYIKEKLTRFKDVKVKDIKDISLEDFVDIGLAELFSGQAVDKDADVKFKPEKAATSAKARMQIIGENAQLSQQVRENLSVAKEMQALGLSKKIIFFDTGWQQGADSMWRYELPDGEINTEELRMLYLGTFNNVISSQTVKITDILEAPELYKAYPSLKNIPVVFTKDKYMDGADGSYSPGGFNMIRINENLLRGGKDVFELKSVLIHELQHAIQHKEGFATGGNLGKGREILNTYFADQARYKQQLRDVIKRIRDFNKVEVRKIEDVLRFYPDIKVYEFEKIAKALIAIEEDVSIEQIENGDVMLSEEELELDILSATRSVKKLLEGLNDMNIEVGSNMSEDIDNTILSIQNEIEGINSPDTAYQAYIRIAGEVEARNVQRRINLPEAKRKELMLEETEDVARGQQFLLFNKGPVSPMASMKERGVDLKGAIEKVIARARAKEISDNVIIAYLMQDKGFDRKKALATIKRVNRKNLRSAIKSLFASVKDITNISEQEAELVKELLKYDRATTRADKAIQKKAKEELLAQVKVMARVSKGKISAAQLSAVISKLSRVNLSRQSSIDNFVDYMRKVFSDADYAQKITGLKSKIAQAKKNIRTKVGVGQDGLTYELANLLNIDPSIIPDDVFNKYEKLITAFGEKKTVLSLPEATQVKKDIADINESLNTQNSLVGELTERFNSFDNKKTTEDGKVEYAPTVKRMLKDEVITEEEAKLMTKFSKEINPREEKEGKSEEQKEKEMEEEKKELVQEVKDSEIDAKDITNPLARKVAESLSEMIKTDAINELSNPQLKNLIKAIDNINSGYVNHYSQLAWENLMGTNFAKTATAAVRKAKPLPLSRALAKLKSKFTGKSDIYTMIERTPLFYMDTVLGDFSSKAIFESILESPSAALANYQTDTKALYETLDKVENKLMRAYKRNGNKIIESKYKQMVYMIQLEHESNPDSKQTRDASEVMEATIQMMYDKNKKRNAEVLEKILKDYSLKGGGIDIKKLKDSFRPVENEMIEAVQGVNASLTDKAVFTAAIIRGEAIDPLNNYVHHQVLSADGSVMDNTDKLSESFFNNAKPSTKAKNLIGRVDEVSAINFDILSATRRGAKMTLIDFHLTSPLRVANKTLNKMEKSLPSRGEQREIFNGIRDGYNQAIKDVLNDNFSSNDFGSEVDSFILKAGYRTMLVGGRFVSELLSNTLFAMKNPSVLYEGMRHRKVAFSALGPQVVKNLNSPNQNRLYADGLSGRLIDEGLLSQAKGTGKGAVAKNKFVNKAAQIGSMATDNMTTRGVIALSDKMISTPDMLATRTIWFGNFAIEFKNLTGQEVDFNKIAENDAAYMSQFKSELKKATKKADREGVLIGATDNPLMGILKNKKRKDDAFTVKMWKNFNGFMQKFLVFEFNAFRIGVQSAMGRGEISRVEGAKLMAAAIVRMTTYVIVTPIVSDFVVSTIGGLFGAAGDDGEEEEKKGTLAQKTARAVTSAGVTLLSGSGGAGVKAALSYGIEFINEKYGAELGFRDEDVEYDSYLNSVSFNIVPPQKGYGTPNLWEDWVPRVSGAYAPVFNTANLGYKLLMSPELSTEEGQERRGREKLQRLPFEMAGLLGLIPFYKESRKALLKDIYKDIGKKKKSSGSKGGLGLPKLPKLGKLPKLPKL
tara:strand:+ start:9332 stop:20413 length:11082 start_codon:yes stop_codon:yes gene_type:complete